jgi:hypothetical protein
MIENAKSPQLTLWQRNTVRHRRTEGAAPARKTPVLAEKAIPSQSAPVPQNVHRRWGSMNWPVRNFCAKLLTAPLVAPTYLAIRRVTRLAAQLVRQRKTTGCHQRLHGPSAVVVGNLDDPSGSANCRDQPIDNTVGPGRRQESRARPRQLRGGTNPVCGRLPLGPSHQGRGGQPAANWLASRRSSL